MARTTKIIMFMGSSASGKSSCIEGLIGKKGLATHADAFEVGTTKLATYETSANGVKYLLVDTPHFDDTLEPYMTTLSKFADFMTLQRENRQKIFGIVYLHSIESGSVHFARALEAQILKAFFRNNSFENLLICTSHWDKVEISVGMARQDLLTITKSGWKDLVNSGAKVLPISDYNQSSWILDHFRDKSSVVLKFEEELLKERLQLRDTSAGRVIVAEEAAQMRRQGFTTTEKIDEIQRSPSAHDQEFLEWREELDQVREQWVEVLREQMSKEPAQELERTETAEEAAQTWTHGSITQRKTWMDWGGRPYRWSILETTVLKEELVRVRKELVEAQREQMLEEPVPNPERVEGAEGAAQSQEDGLPKEGTKGKQWGGHTPDPSRRVLIREISEARKQLAEVQLKQASKAPLQKKKRTQRTEQEKTDHQHLRDTSADYLIRVPPPKHAVPKPAPMPYWLVKPEESGQFLASRVGSDKYESASVSALSSTSSKVIPKTAFNVHTASFESATLFFVVARRAQRRFRERRKQLEHFISAALLFVVARRAQRRFREKHNHINEMPLSQNRMDGESNLEIAKLDNFLKAQDTTDRSSASVEAEEMAKMNIATFSARAEEAAISRISEGSVETNEMTMVGMPSSPTAMDELASGAVELTTFFLEDDGLQLSFQKLKAEPSLSPSDFEEQLRMQLKHVAKRMSNGSSDDKWTRWHSASALKLLQHTMANLVSAKAPVVARLLRKSLFPEDSESTPASPLYPKSWPDVPRSGTERFIDWLTRRCDNPDVHPQDARLFLWNSSVLSEFRDSIRQFVEEPYEDRVELIRRWRDETGSCLPFIFFDCVTLRCLRSSPSEPLSKIELSTGSVEFLNEESYTAKDKIQLFINNITKVRWDWWPLLTPRSGLEKDKVRVVWNQETGYACYKDVSPGLAENLHRAIHRGLFIGCSPSSSQTPDLSGRSRSSMESPMDGYDCVAERNTSDTISVPDSKQQNPGTGRNRVFKGYQRSNQIPGVTDSYSAAQMMSDTLIEKYVLLCVPGARRLLSTQMKVKNVESDDTFFSIVRAEYVSLRGVLRYWLSPKRFSHCRFSRMTRFAADHLEHKAYEVPKEEKDYEYKPRPPDDPYIEPIGENEWFVRFHGLAKTGQVLEALPLVPKRMKAFQISTHFSGRENMWGLHVEYLFSFVGVLMYCLLLIAGPVGFWIWWLRTHPGDWQTATTLLSTWLAVLSFVWFVAGDQVKDAL